MKAFLYIRLTIIGYHVKAGCAAAGIEFSNSTSLLRSISTAAKVLYFGHTLSRDQNRAPAAVLLLWSSNFLNLTSAQYQRSSKNAAGAAKMLLVLYFGHGFSCTAS
jgi:hypothetical protein